eukprot:304851-Prymnesium_polylepis.1
MVPLCLAVALHATALFSARPRVSIEQADTTAKGALRAVARLSAEGLSTSAEESEKERYVLAEALSKDLAPRFSPRNREDSALLTAVHPEAAADEIVGVCGIEVVRLTPAALDAQRASEGEIFTLKERPLLSNLAGTAAKTRSTAVGAQSLAASGHREAAVPRGGGGRALMGLLGGPAASREGQCEGPQSLPWAGLSGGGRRPRGRAP